MHATPFASTTRRAQVRYRSRGWTASTASERVLATLLVVDIVGSTQRAVELGDRRWRAVLDDYDLLVERALAQHRGRLVNGARDGVLATFAGPARALRCAVALGEAARAIGVELRAGVHTGECEARAGDVAGIAVHVAARLQAAARPGEVLASSTVRDLVAGSGLAFEDRGRRVLRGIPGEWSLFAVARDAERRPRGPAPADPRAQADDLSDLSRRELEVLALIAEGRTNEEIAASLCLSNRTVERHLSNVYAKLRLSGKAARAAAAARFASARELLPGAAACTPPCAAVEVG
jgi:class 3 adenylate cyclase